MNLFELMTSKMELNGCYKAGQSISEYLARYKTKVIDMGMLGYVRCLKDRQGGNISASYGTYKECL